MCNALTYNLVDTGPGGGKIFYRLEVGFTQYTNAADTVGTTAHYLEAAPTDMPSKLAWQAANSDINGTGSAIGTGRKNTVLILAGEVEAPAAKTCNDYSNNGKTDWFLPSRHELNELYTNRTSVGNNWETGNYLSSTQSSWNYVCYCNFSNGYLGTDGYKNVVGFSVRTVRAF